MSLAFFADSLAILIGLGVLAVGARFLFMPRAAAIGYGVPAEPRTPGTGPYLTIKGVRDGIYGVLVFVLLATGGRHVLAWFMLTAAVLPLADADRAAEPRFPADRLRRALRHGHGHAAGRGAVALMTAPATVTSPACPTGASNETGGGGGTGRRGAAAGHPRGPLPRSWWRP